jgi:glutathione synthase/RimK-type ligase-like ATP-grasp enzyme
VILAVTSDEDVDAVPVLDLLASRGAQVQAIDISDWPGRAGLAFDSGDGSGERWLLPGDGPPIHAADVTAVWWRSTRPFVTHPGLSAGDAAFAVRQTWEALQGFWASLPARYVNQPWRNEIASHKAHQLPLAERCGLRVPRTLITNDVARAQAFVAAARGAPVIHKALHATPVDWHPTRLLTKAERADLSAVRLAPVILQEYVEGVDLRVYAVGDRLFTAEIDARATASPEDFRTVFDEARVAPCSLPPAVEAGLRRLMAELGIVYGAIDLRRRGDGEHLFLEVNPAGLWRFVEQRTGLPISAAIADLLLGG